MITATAARMVDRSALFRLMTWMSPAYPVGAYTYSQGLEWAVEDGTVTDTESLDDWLTQVLRHGTGHTDAILFRHAHEAAAAGDLDGLLDVADLAAAFQPSSERRLEALAQGRAFALATLPAFSSPMLAKLEAARPDALAYTVTVAVAAADQKIAVEDALAAFLHGVAANLVSAGVRLIPLGQSAGLKVLTALEPVMTEVADATRSLSLDELGGATVIADIASMRHETQYTRLFRS
ncbi:MAG: urease accessory protein UreF [Hyphomicrobiales bacterium]|nr:MAG: urease accessory protein UreF [Hyphomicrobiales bacterium]